MTMMVVLLLLTIKKKQRAGERRLRVFESQLAKIMFFASKLPPF